MAELNLPKGFTCECGEFHVFPDYVFAHWIDELTHICQRCGRKHAVQRGIAALVNEDDHDDD